MSLLDKAKAQCCNPRAKIEITDEHIELALAWMRGEITISQAMKIGLTKNRSTTVVYSVMARALRNAYEQGVLKIADENSK